MTKTVHRRHPSIRYKTRCGRTWIAGDEHLLIAVHDRAAVTCNSCRRVTMDEDIHAALRDAREERKAAGPQYGTMGPGGMRFR